MNQKTAKLIDRAARVRWSIDPRVRMRFRGPGDLSRHWRQLWTGTPWRGRSRLRGQLKDMAVRGQAAIGRLHG